MTVTRQHMPHNRKTLAARPRLAQRRIPSSHRCMSPVRRLSDVTEIAELRVMVANVQFDHRFFLFALVFSRWKNLNFTEGGDSFEDLS